MWTLIKYTASRSVDVLRKTMCGHGKVTRGETGQHWCAALEWSGLPYSLGLLLSFHVHICGPSRHSANLPPTLTPPPPPTVLGFAGLATEPKAQWAHCYAPTAALDFGAINSCRSEVSWITSINHRPASSGDKTNKSQPDTQPRVKRGSVSQLQLDSKDYPGYC